MKNKKKKVSVYLKADRTTAVSYYRFFQYYDKMDVNFCYHLMIAERHWGIFFPISVQPIWKKILIFFYIYFRVLFNLIKDAIIRPDYLVISRCLINLVLPYIYRVLLIIIKKRGCKIIFDFDDQIIQLKEVTKEGFNFLSKVSNNIVVGSPLLRELVNIQYINKVTCLPTTDGDIHGLVSANVTDQRLTYLETEIRIVWLGTFPGLKYVNEILPAIEEFAICCHKKVVLTIVCDQPLDYYPINFDLVFKKWDRDVAIDIVLSSHIGIMPLQDNIGTRGKCSFKLIQYLSAGLPIIGSAVGMNKLVINDNVGIALTSNDKILWANALQKLTKSKDTWNQYSMNAYKEWDYKYNYTYNYSCWKNLFEL